MGDGVERMDLTRGYRIGDWRVDPGLDEIERNGQRIKLEPRVMRLLCCLAERAGQVVSVEELLDRIWPGVVVGQSSVYQAIAHLRRVLEDTESPPHYIVTVPRKGYRLIAAVCAEEPSRPGAVTDDTHGRAPAQVTAPAAVDHPASAPVTTDLTPTVRISRRGWLIVAITIAVVAATTFTIRRTMWSQPRPARAPVIAVLPFSDLSADGSYRALCDGLTDELSGSLARLRGVQVVGRTSTAKFRNDARRVSAGLGASHVLQGSVRLNDGRLHVKVELVDAVDGVQVWANSFDRPARDVVLTRSRVARAVVDAIASQLGPDRGGPAPPATSTRVNAYELYLLGRHQQLRRGPDGIAQAISYYKAAVAADPVLALAHAGLADAYMARYREEDRPLEEVARLAQAEVDTALRLDPELSAAYSTWSLLLTEQGRTQEATAAAERALAIDSGSSEAYLRLGYARERSGLPRQALAAYDQSAALDPLNAAVHVRRCFVLQHLGHHAQAEQACERGFELQPDLPDAPWARALNAYAEGRLAAAVGHYHAALARAPVRRDIRLQLATVYLDLGMHAEAAAEFRRLGQHDARASLAPGYGEWLLATRDPDGLRSMLRSVEENTTPQHERVRAAWLALAAEEARIKGVVAAARLAFAAGATPVPAIDVEPLQFGTCDPCGLALLQRRAGDAEAGRRSAQLASTALDRLEERGYVMHGLRYARAGLLGQENRPGPALAALQRAVDSGWRRAWLMRVDPALATLRQEPGFAALVARIEAANLQSRRELNPSLDER